MNVTISTYGRFPPAFVLARYLAEHSMLDRLVSPLPRFKVEEFGVPDDLMAPLPPVGMWNAAVRRWAPTRVQGWNQHPAAVGYDVLAATRLGDPDIFNGWTGSSLLSSRRARRRGAKYVLTTGSAHIRRQAEIVDAEMTRWGFPARTTHPGIIRRAMKEYDEADAILVPSNFVRRTFLDEGVPADKLHLVPWATPPKTTASGEGRTATSGKVRVLFVGACSIRKGIPHLLLAAKELGDLATVHLVGPPSRAVFDAAGGLPENVVAVGTKGGADLANEFDQADVFVLPSVEDGSALVILEAMMAGLPVIVSDQAGAALIAEGESGFTVPAADAGAIAERIRQLAADPDLRLAVGQRAREVASARTLEDYGDEVVGQVFTPLLSA